MKKMAGGTPARADRRGWYPHQYGKQKLYF